MNKWYICKIKYNKTDDNGLQRRVTEPYLIDAVSHTEAEVRIYEKMSEEITAEFTVVAIVPVNYSEVIPNENADDWYKCKVAFVMLDEDSGKEKKVNSYSLIQANTVKEAVEVVDESFKEMLAPYQILNVGITAIIEVFPYFTDQITEEIQVNLKEVESHE